MEDTQPVDGLIQELDNRRKRDKTRRYLVIVLVLWLLTFAALVAVAWNAYFKERQKALTLAEQVTVACEEGNLAPWHQLDPTRGLSPEERKVLCANAKKVVEQNDPELQDNEIQEPEIQDPETQEPEIQEPEKQVQEKQDSETQDPETQDPEIQDEETQEPEINDPDPNDPPKSGTCTFDGKGTIKFTWQTDNGPETIECTGTQGDSGPAPTP